MSKTSKTHRADGTPTAYGFACGHGLVRKQDVAGTTPAKHVTCFLEGGVFAIKTVDWSKWSAEAHAWLEQHGWNDPYDFRKWRTATTVHEARRIFAMECKRIGLRVTP